MDVDGEAALMRLESRTDRVARRERMRFRLARNEDDGRVGTIQRSPRVAAGAATRFSADVAASAASADGTGDGILEFEEERLKRRKVKILLGRSRRRRERRKLRNSD